MRYSTKPRKIEFVEGYVFLSFAIKFGGKYGKKLIDTATKTGIDAAKTASDNYYILCIAQKNKPKQSINI